MPETDTVPTAEISAKNFSGAGVDLLTLTAKRYPAAAFLGFSRRCETMSGRNDGISEPITIANVGD